MSEIKANKDMEDIDKIIAEGANLGDIIPEDPKWEGEISTYGEKTYKCPNCGGDYVIEFNGEYVCMNCYFKDERREFLTRLGDLLKEFGAKIDCRYHEVENYRGDLPCVDFGNGEILVWEEINGVTSENVMNVKNVE